MKKILLTGGSGFFASRFSKYYKDKYKIYNIKREELDVTNEKNVFEKFNKIKPDYVIHTAAIAVTNFCDNNPEISYKVNVEGTINVAKATKNVNGKLIFISTEQIFNGNKNHGPYNEDQIAVPNTVYGKNKLQAEGFIREIIDDHYILRFSWLFGLPEFGCNMTSNILFETMNTVKNGKIMKVPSNEFRGITYVYEIIEKMEKVFQIPYGTYHMSSKNDLSRYEIVKFILECIGEKDNINKLLINDTKKNIRDIRLDTSKIEEFGIVFTDSKKAIKKCINENNLKKEI